MSVKRVLVAGAAGFLGSHLVDALLAKGYTVVGIDNYCTGRPQNLAHLSNQERWQFMEGDITNPLPAALIEQPFDSIANLACPASPVDYQRLPLETLRVNAAGVENLLRLAQTSQARFIHTSTSEVYGDPAIHPQTEEYWGNVNSYGERSCYDEGKRYAEALIYSYRKLYGLNTGITRLFNTYGPRMRPADGRVMTNFIQQALAGADITIYGDGSQTRSFCYVDDQIRAQLAMLESSCAGPVNIGNPREFTIRQLAEEIIKQTGSRSRLVYRPLPPDDPRRRQPDITKARRELAWQPTVELAEGVRHMVNWMQQHKITV